MKTGRPLKPLDLTAEERLALEALIRRSTIQHRVAQRAQIVLECAQGVPNRTVAQRLRICQATVCKWRERFRIKRLDGLADEPRPGGPRTISDAQVEEVVVKTLETRPPEATHWSTRGMARAMGISHDSVARIWHTFGLKPHIQDTFKLSNDPFLVEKVRDIVGLYLHPPAKALVLSVDEKSQIQALDRTQPLLPLGPGQPERRTHDYVRHGITSLFAALNVGSGEVIGECYRRHRQQEFLKFLNRISDQLPAAQEVHVILDNYGTHKTPKVRRWFLRRRHWHLHFTPTSASWLNQVERFFSEITTRRIRRGVFRSVPALEQAIRDYLAHRNTKPRPFIWAATADSILGKIKRHCERTLLTGD